MDLAVALKRGAWVSGRAEVAVRRDEIPDLAVTQVPCGGPNAVVGTVAGQVVEVEVSRRGAAAPVVPRAVLVEELGLSECGVDAVEQVAVAGLPLDAHEVVEYLGVDVMRRGEGARTCFGLELQDIAGAEALRRQRVHAGEEGDIAIEGP